MLCREEEVSFIRGVYAYVALEHIGLVINTFCYYNY